MSGAPAVAAPAPTAASPLAAATPSPGHAEPGDPRPGASFDDVLSQQSAGSPHDTYGERQGSNGPKVPGAKARQIPSSSPSNASLGGMPTVHPTVDTLSASLDGSGRPDVPRPESSFLRGAHAPGADDRRTPSGVDGAAHAVAPLPTARPVVRDDGSASEPEVSSAPPAEGGDTSPMTTELAVGTVTAIGTGSGESVGPAAASKVMATASPRGLSALSLRDPPAHVETGASNADSAAPASPLTTEGLDAVSSPFTPIVRDVPMAARLAASGADPVPPTTTAAAMPHSSITLDVDGLSGTISRPLSNGDGTYTVVVALHPPDLGHLRAVMSLDGNDLDVSITPQSQAGHDALTKAGDALKNQLSGNGLNVNVTLRDPGSRSGADDQPSEPARGGSALPDGAPAPQRPAMPDLVAGQIHLVL